MHGDQRLLAKLSEFLTNPEQWSSSLSGTGAVHRLERRFAALVGRPYALTVANATLGLWAAFLALGVRDAEVVTTPYTWGGSLTGLMLAGNRPVFADIDADTLVLDPESVAQRITKRTKAILAVDIYGYPSAGPRLRKIADDAGVVLIQDCAQSFGAYLGSHHTGFWADAAIFSLGPGKALCAGEGGVIVVHDRSLYEQLVWTTQHPLRQLKDTPRLPPSEMGLNLRVNSLSAALAEARFDEAVRQVECIRKRSVKILTALALSKVSRTLQPNLTKVRPSFHVLSFEPAVSLDKVEKLVLATVLGATVCRPSVYLPLWAHGSYPLLASRNRCKRPEPCPVAKQQCEVRLCIKHARQFDRRGRW